MTLQGPATGLIVANHGRHFWVESPDGERRICHSRGKKSVGVVGDRVLWQASGHEGTIERIEARRDVVVVDGDGDGATVVGGAVRAVQRVLQRGRAQRLRADVPAPHQRAPNSK